MMHEVQIEFMNYVRKAHRYYGHETDAHRLAHVLGLEIKTGRDNTLIGKTITIRREDRYTRREPRIIRHEIAHHLLQRSGTDSELMRLRCTYEEATPSIENLCYHAALVLHMPEPQFRSVLYELGDTPEGIVRLAELSGASTPEAMHRWVYAEVDVLRAGWLIRRGLVREVARTDMWLSFWRYSDAEEAVADLPEARCLPIPSGETLALWSADFL